MNEILTIKQASELLEVKERTLAEKARAGEVPAHKFLGKWFFLLSELIACIKSHGTQEPPPQQFANLPPSPAPVPKVSVKNQKVSQAKTHNETSRINAANNPIYAQLVSDIQSANTYSNQELANMHGVSKSIVGKVKAGLSLIEKYNLK